MIILANCETGTTHRFVDGVLCRVVLQLEDQLVQRVVGQPDGAGVGADTVVEAEVALLGLVAAEDGLNEGEGQVAGVLQVAVRVVEPDQLARVDLGGKEEKISKNQA